jgi:hypothetical protein
MRWAADRPRKSGAAQAGAAAASATTETGQAAGSGRFSGRFGLSLSWAPPRRSAELVAVP